MRTPPSQTWRSFLRNHTLDLVSIDFFVVPTATFRILYVFLVLEHGRRRIVHLNVIDALSARWTAEQLVNAFPYDSAPRYVIRDRDKIYGAAFVRRVRAIGIEQVLTAPQSPWQNPYCERVIGTLRRECLNHVIVLGEQHLPRILPTRSLSEDLSLSMNVGHELELGSLRAAPVDALPGTLVSSLGNASEGIELPLLACRRRYRGWHLASNEVLRSHSSDNRECDDVRLCRSSARNRGRVD